MHLAVILPGYHAVVFSNDYATAKGCKVEYELCKQYGIKIIDISKTLKEIKENGLKIQIEYEVVSCGNGAVYSYGSTDGLGDVYDRDDSIRGGLEGRSKYINRISGIQPSNESGDESAGDRKPWPHERVSHPVLSKEEIDSLMEMCSRDIG